MVRGEEVGERNSVSFQHTLVILFKTVMAIVICGALFVNKSNFQLQFSILM